MERQARLRVICAPHLLLLPLTCAKVAVRSKLCIFHSYALCLVIYTDYMFVLAKHRCIDFISSKKEKKNQRENGEIC